MNYSNVVSCCKPFTAGFTFYWNCTEKAVNEITANLTTRAFFRLNKPWIFNTYKETISNYCLWKYVVIIWDFSLEYTSALHRRTTNHKQLACGLPLACTKRGTLQTEQKNHGLDFHQHTNTSWVWPHDVVSLGECLRLPDQLFTGNPNTA